MSGNHALRTVPRPGDAPAGDLSGDDLVAAAARLAREFLQDLHPRWEHTRAVAARAAAGAGAVAPDDRALLVAAAWLHDVGYAPALRVCGFHPLDGGDHLRRQGWPPLLAALVAHHSGARFVARVRDLSAALAVHDDPRAVQGPLADALTWADQTVSATGEVVDVEERLADVLRRHGPDSPNARCHHLRGPYVREAVRRTEERLRRPGGSVVLPPGGPRD
ncbi:HD domain-containing protein [Kineococcus sp. SYSU DK018]|uniref:HD domain-containing protein n=1 Tax=Kineococcus sp. SYSU DK018 TaxID=3383139 RepID=UPI003D7DBAC4